MALKDFRKKIEQLPPELKRVFLSNETAEIIFRATTSYGLSAEQQSQTARLVSRILLKELKLSEFALALKQELGLAEGVAQGLAASISRHLFNPLTKHFPQAVGLTNQWQRQAQPPSQPAQSLNLSQPEDSPQIVKPRFPRPSAVRIKGNVVDLKGKEDSK